ncbi:hypothetical protein BRADI_4g09141v3 [Brachypodium distachyon]|uniref:Uncharacterized protein n=1 Tax=Brachypodium distachyon TaxID=15368 RepID=A0A2K2CLH2_BRADI|nr:hypothetical protein BRADI_4g09141v3 [Brachypodium distachyon]
MIDCLGLWDFYGKDVCDKRMSDKTSSHHAISQGRLLTSIIAYCNVNSCHHDKMIDFLGFLWERWLC